MTLPVTTPVDTFGEPGEPVPIGAVFAGAIGTLTGTVEVPPWPSETVRLNVSVVADRSAPRCRSCVPCGRIRRVVNVPPAATTTVPFEVVVLPP